MEAGINCLELFHSDAHYEYHCLVKHIKINVQNKLIRTDESNSRLRENLNRR